MIRKVCLAALVVLLSVGCTSHFITDQEYLGKVEQDFAGRDSVMKASGISLETMGLKQDELEAMKFLYAYMPLGDIVNQEFEYFLDSYRLTKKALAQMPWGKSVPEREVRHFVLPVRVNNENLDASREVFFE